MNVAVAVVSIPRIEERLRVIVALLLVLGVGMTAKGLSRCSRASGLSDAGPDPNAGSRQD